MYSSIISNVCVCMFHVMNHIACINKGSVLEREGRARCASEKERETAGPRGTRRKRAAAAWEGRYPPPLVPGPRAHT